MKICIIGWYGTETLGDRAILDGIIYIFTKISNNIEISIGSLYPTVTERTILEDGQYYNRFTKINFNIFDVFNKKKYHKAIKDSDMLIMGGGPLMDLEELYIILHGFKYAKLKRIHTVLFGCGYGPLNNNVYKTCVSKIVHYSDLVIMRSKKCYEKILTISAKEDYPKINFSCDPAAISVNQFYQLNKNKIKKNNKWIMNIRDLDYVNNTQKKYYDIIKKNIILVSSQVPNLVLYPMHTFFIGGDDRYIENMLKNDIGSENITVIQKPLSLEECYKLVISSQGCIGMRYHSILFQTILNGNNYVIDYTDYCDGKIISFLNEFDQHHFYKDRYININQINDNSYITIKENNSLFKYQSEMIESGLDIYIKLLTKILKGNHENYCK